MPSLAIVLEPLRFGDISVSAGPGQTTPVGSSMLIKDARRESDEMRVTSHGDLRLVVATSCRSLILK